MNYCIYALIDPRTENVRYIGRSSSGLVRATQHAQPCRLTKDRTHKGNWIRELQSLGFKYTFRCLEEVLQEELDEAEKYWIWHGRRNGWPLTNLTEGGRGLNSYLFSEQHKKNISKANKGRKLSLEQKQKLSLRSRQRRVDHTKLEAMWIARRGSHHSEQAKAKIGAAHRGKTVSAEARFRVGLANSCPVKDINSGVVFPSLKAAALALGLCPRSIGLVCRGKFKQTGGHQFSYI